MNKFLVTLFTSCFVWPILSTSFSRPVIAACPAQLNNSNVTITTDDALGCNVPSSNTYVIDVTTSESSTSNGGQLNINGSSLIIFNTGNLVLGTLSLGGGYLTVQNGGQLSVGSSSNPKWVADADADGWAANFTTYDATAAGRRRLGLMRSTTVADCNDNAYSVTNTCYTSFYPSFYPNFYPSFYPSFYPTFYPNFYPSFYPNFYPSFYPNFYPSFYPAFYPLFYPTNQPY